MLKARILHKALILVAIPLVFGMLFVSRLCQGFSESNRIFQHQLSLKNAMITGNVVMRTTFTANKCALAYFLSNEPFFKEKFSSNLRASETSYGHFCKLLQNEKDIQIPLPPVISEGSLISGNAEYLRKMNALMKQLEGLTERERNAALKSMDRLQVVLVSGMLAGCLITVALAVYFFRSITNRIFVIVHNTLGLSKGTPLRQPLKGSDEIAELDQFLYKAANEVRDLERFRKEMISVVSHELKSPLSSVEMFLSSLRTGVYGNLTRASEEKVGLTHRSVVRLMDLVRKLLYLERLDEGIQPVSIDPQEKFTHSTFAKSGFSLLKKGLIIISLPLIFQFIFVSTIGCLLYQVREQVDQEQRSEVMLSSLNRMTENSALGSYYGIMYAFTRKPDQLDRWKAARQENVRLYQQVQYLSADDPARQADIKKAGQALIVVSDLIETMIKSKQEIDLPDLDEIKAGGPVGFTKLRSLLQDSGALKLVIPFADGLAAQQNLLLHEKRVSERLARQSKFMLANLKFALSFGFVLNIVLSTCLAVYVIRNITGRLQHVMENTVRLLNRQPLEQPVNGRDEIAYLDKTLFETAHRLYELQSFKREMISTVSRELRNPLLTISASLEFYSRGGLGELSAKAYNRLEIAQDEARRLIRLINDLLDIEKMEAGKFELNLTVLKVADLIRSSIEAVASLADAKQIKVESTFRDTALSADRDRMCQVLINLLSNAIKFSPESTTINLIVEIKNQEIEFHVSDHGRGIPEEFKQNIFNRFVQVEKSDASERGGSGLGLAISKAIIEQHGGIIGVESTVGSGSTFWFKLPDSSCRISNYRSEKLLPQLEPNGQVSTLHQEPVWRACMVSHHYCIVRLS